MVERSPGGVARPIPAGKKPNVLKLLTLARDLRRRKARERQGLFAAEGVRAVEELVRSPLVIRGVLVAPQLADAPRGAALLASLRQRRTEVVEVSPLELGSAAETDSPQGVVAVAEIPERSLDDLVIPARARLVLLDGVQDPGNVGTIVRAAGALGPAFVSLSAGCSDPLSGKGVRASMGAVFRVPIEQSADGPPDGLPRIALAAGDGVPLWELDLTGPALLLVGAERLGLPPELVESADHVARIPQAPGADSLNAAAAATVALYEAVRQRA